MPLVVVAPRHLLEPRHIGGLKPLKIRLARGAHQAMVMVLTGRYGGGRFEDSRSDGIAGPSAPGRMEWPTSKDIIMRNLLLVLGLLALAIGVLWIGQGTGMVAWPRTSFNQIEWAGYGAVLGAVGLILIWQSKR